MRQSLHQSEGMILISLRMGRLMKTNLAKSSLFWTTVMYKYMFLQQIITITTVCSSLITQTSRLFFAQGITVQAVINNVTKTFTLNNLSSVRSRQDLGKSGVDDMIQLSDLNEASLLWNLRLRYDSNQIYTYTGKE